MHLGGLGDPLGDGGAEQLQRARLRARDPLGRIVGRGGLGLGVEEDRRYVNPGDAVDEAVVALADDREPLLAEPVDHPQLPERLRAVEPLREGPGGERAELLLVAGGGQGGVADVVVEVEVRVVDPDRAALVERHEAQLLAEARDEVEPRARGAP